MRGGGGARSWLGTVEGRGRPGPAAAREVLWQPRRLPRTKPPTRPTATGCSSTVRRGKTNQEGETRDVRFVKGGVVGALRTLRAAASPALEDRVVPLSPKMVELRFQAAASGMSQK